MISFNKNHWYDGWFYDKFIGPSQDKMFFEIKHLIQSGSNVLDVGCGTGRLAFTLSDKCKSIVGIDISQRNIERANKNLYKNPRSNISFIHTDVETLKHNTKNFDYAILTYVLHEVDETKRLDLLRSISSVAEKIIIGDYLVPQTLGFWKILNEVIEFIAGKEHYRNFKSYINNNGIEPLAQKAGLQISNEIIDKKINSKIVVLEK